MRTALLWTAASLLLFVLVEAAIFRSGVYYPYLEPQSSAGTVYSYMYWLKHQPHTATPEVLVLGDSRMAEGFSAVIADEAAGQRLHFWNFGMPGTTPRIWYYMLRNGDPTRRRFAKIVIPIDDYTDTDIGTNPADRVQDLSFAITQLRWTDCIGFANSFPTWAHRTQMLSGCLFQGVTLRPDLQALLLDAHERVRAARDWLKNGIAYLNGYASHAESLAGLTADLENRTVTFPAGVPQAAQDNVRDRLLPDPVPQTGSMTRYREEWLTGILDLYKGSPTQIVLFELARTPLPRPESTAPKTWLDSIRARSDVTVLPQHTFRDLERPEFFFDGLHFNRDGRKVFTERLVQLLGAQ